MMMKKMLLASLVPLAMASLARSASAADASDLKVKFASALSIVSDATASIVHKPMPSTANLQAAYGSGAVAASITASVKTDAQELLLETSDLVRDLANALITGTANPSQELHDKVCDLTHDGLEKRRFAPFYDGYDEVHQEFKDFLYQFVEISEVMECDGNDGSGSTDAGKGSGGFFEHSVFDEDYES